MLFSHLEKQTARWVLLIWVACTCIWAWYIISAQNRQHDVATPLVEAAPLPIRQISSSPTPEAVAAELPKAQLITVATQVVATPVPVTYDYNIPQSYTLTRIEQETCNPIDDVLHRNLGNPAIKSRDTIIAGGIITLLKVEPCSPAMAKAKAFPENIPRRIVRGGSPEASHASGTHERDARTEQDVPVQVAGMSRRQTQELARDNCSAAAWGKKHGSADWIVAIADCIETKWGATIDEGLREQVDNQRIPAEDLEIHKARFIALVIAESAGNPRAKSVPLKPDRDPCYGLSQIQPGTGKDFGLPFHEIYHPQKNLRTGIRVLYDYAAKFGGRIVHGLVAYNIGSGNDAWNFKNYHRRVERLEIPYARDIERMTKVLLRVAAERKPKEPEPLLEDNPA